MIRRFFLILVLALAAALPGRGAEAQQCLDVSAEEAQLHAAELVTLLQIATFRGDLKYMSDVAPELESYLDSCGSDPGGRLAQVCGFDCHLQLARYRLFLASDLPFLSTAGVLSRDSTLLSPQNAQQHAEDGIAVVERGLKLLARQQGSGEEEDAFRTYTRQLVGLSSVKIRLRMTVGDTWYQTMSEARVKSLGFAVSEALEVIPGAALEDQPNLHKAHTQYEFALWTLIETKTDIPAEQSYDDLRADLAILEGELQARMESLRRGMIFLNIDPVAFTTIPFEELQQALDRTKRDLEAVEARMEAIVREWSAASEGQATRAIDERRVVRGQKVNLLAHQIGKLETEAQILTGEVQQEISALDAELDTFSRRQQIRNLEIALSTKIAEFENRRQQLQERQALDLIAITKEAEIERRAELRWMLSFEMTRMNLDLQVSSLESQIGEYDRQLARNRTQLETLARQRAILETRIVDAQNSIEGAQQRIERIDLTQVEVHALRRSVIREDICGVENQLAFIGETLDSPFTPALPGEEPCDVVSPSFTRVEYQETMCGTDSEPGLRAKLNDARILGRAFVLKCVIGDPVELAELEPMAEASTLIDSGMSLEDELDTVSCNGFSQTEVDFAKGIYDAEKALLEKQRFGLEQQRDKVNEQLDFVSGWASDFQNTILGLQTGLAVVQGAYAALAGVPETTVAAAGMASGVYTTIKVDKPAYAVMEAARVALNTALAFGKINIQTESQVRAFATQLTNIREANERIDFEKAVKALALHRAHFQLAGKRAEGLQAIKDLELQGSMAAVDCENAQLGIDEQVARLTAQHTRMLATMELQAEENALLDFDRLQQEGLIERYFNEIDILRLELEKLALNEAQLTEDNAQLGALVGAAQGRINRIELTRATVEGLAEESQQVTTVIAELRQRQADQQLAISNSELAFVEARIRGEEGNTEQLVNALQGSIELVGQRAELKAQIEQVQADMLGQVAEQREQMVNLASEIDDPDERRQLFIASQETLSELLRGIPDYISAKRTSLTTANRLLHLMRQRYSLVLGITGRREDYPLTYVKDAAQLTALVSEIEGQRFFDETEIPIEVARVVVPSQSGFVKKLALDEEVTFEISPFAGSDDAMREAGFFVIWDDKFRERKTMTLIDVLIGAQYTCTGAQWNTYTLRHLGSGTVFRPLAEGSPVTVPERIIGPSRGGQHTFYNMAANEADLNRVLSYWQFNRFAARKFPRMPGPPNDQDAILPFLGAPVYGTYKLAVNPSDCPFEGAVFTLLFLFASTP